MNRSPSLSRSSRSPLRSVSWTRDPAFISHPAMRPSQVSRTRSTSSPLWVRKYAAVVTSSDQRTCLRISPTANVSTRCPNSVSTAGSRNGPDAAFQPDGLPGFGDVEHLAGLRRQLVQQSGKRFSLPYSGDAEHVAHHHEVQVVGEP